MTDNYAGLLLITYNDEENLKKMLPSLEETIDYPTVIYCLDFSTDNSVELLSKFEANNKNNNIKSMMIISQKLNYLPSLTETMNYGFRYLMSRQECEYIGWIHPDMLMKNYWLSRLVNTLEQRPDIGKICAYNNRDCENAPFAEPYPGHEQCYVVRRGVLLQTGLFDEKFIGIGGYEDWDLNRRIVQEGWKVCIDPNVHVLHKGMATRERRDTTEEQIHNAGVYKAKWGDTREVVE